MEQPLAPTSTKQKKSQKAAAPAPSSTPAPAAVPEKPGKNAAKKATANGRPATPVPAAPAPAPAPVEKMTNGKAPEVPPVEKVTNKAAPKPAKKAPAPVPTPAAAAASSSAPATAKSAAAATKQLERGLQPKKVARRSADDSDDDDDADAGEDMEDVKTRAINEAIAKMSGGQLSKGQKAEVRQKAQAMLGPMGSADVACVGHLKQLTVLANRHGKKLMKNPAPIREYFKLMFALSRKPPHERQDQAKVHVAILRRVYERYREQLLQDDLTWLDSGTTAEPTGNGIVVITYGKGDRAKVPLSELYHYLNATDDEKLLTDGVELDHHLWSIFSKLATDPKEQKRYEELATECQSSTAPENAMQGISAKIRDKVLADPTAVDLEADTADPEKIVGTVFQTLKNDEDMKKALQGFTSSAVDGTFDFDRMLRAVQDGVGAPTSNADVDEDAPPLDVTASAPVAEPK
jgi:hypothetical protein